MANVHLQLVSSYKTQASSAFKDNNYPCVKDHRQMCILSDFPLLITAILFARDLFSGIYIWQTDKLQHTNSDSKVVDLIESLYTDTCSCINVDGVMSDWFEICSSVSQDRRIAPDFFLSAMDYPLGRTVHLGMPGGV